MALILLQFLCWEETRILSLGLDFFFTLNPDWQTEEKKRACKYVKTFYFSTNLFDFHKKKGYTFFSCFFYNGLI